MPDYSKGVIYRIYCKDSSITDCYVGSSCNIQKRIRFNSIQERPHTTWR